MSFRERNKVKMQFPSCFYSTKKLNLLCIKRTDTKVIPLHEFEEDAYS